jgi:hypothetical protein
MEHWNVRTIRVCAKWLLPEMPPASFAGLFLMSSHKAPRLVPWTCHAEWLFVYHSLLPKTVEIASKNGLEEFADESVETALKVIDAWRQRSGLPKAVDSSYNFVSILRSQAKRSSSNEQHNSTHELDQDDNNTRHALNSALIRFVNQMCDSEQKSTHARPILRIASSLGLSRMLVDIRHEGTHDALPCLSWLMLGARVALEWLREHYWQAQEEWKELLKESFATSLRKCMNSRDIKDKMMDVDHLVYSSETLEQILIVLLNPEFIVKGEAVRDALDCLIDWIEPGRVVATMQGIKVDSVYDRYKHEHIQYTKQKSKLDILDECTTGVKRKFEGEGEESVADKTRRLIKQLEERRMKTNANAQEASQLCGTINGDSTDSNSSWVLTESWQSCPLGTCVAYNPLKGQTFRQLFVFP